MENKDISETNLGNDTNLVIDSFLINALKNPKIQKKDCSFVLKIDKEMEMFMKDKSMTQKKFPPMNGYQRMIVHKIAHYYNLSHSYLNDKNAVTVVKNEKSEIPLLRLQDLIEESEEEVRPSVRLLKKPKINNNVETKIIIEDTPTKVNTDNIEPETKMTPKYSPPENVKILKKTEKKEEEKPIIQPLKPISEIKVLDEKDIEVKLEEREKEYEIARARIFNDNKVEEYIETETLEIKPKEIKTDDSEYNDDVFLLNASYTAPSGNFVPPFDFNYQFMNPPQSYQNVYNQYLYSPFYPNSIPNNISPSYFTLGTPQQIQPPHQPPHPPPYSTPRMTNYNYNPQSYYVQPINPYYQNMNNVEKIPYSNAGFPNVGGNNSPQVDRNGIVQGIRNMNINKSPKIKQNNNKQQQQQQQPFFKKNVNKVQEINNDNNIEQLNETQATNHILEVEVLNKDATKENIMTILKRICPNSIKECSQFKYILIFKNSNYAKKVLETFKHEDILLKPFELKVNAGNNSFSSNVHINTIKS
jgi:hypothetical protein